MKYFDKEKKSYHSEKLSFILTKVGGTHINPGQKGAFAGADVVLQNFQVSQSDSI